jgi:hypothetical protein
MLNVEMEDAIKDATSVTRGTAATKIRYTGHVARMQ